MKTNFKHCTRFKHDDIYIDIHHNLEESDEIKAILINYLKSIPERKFKSPRKLQNYLHRTIEKHGGAHIQPEFRYSSILNNYLIANVKGVTNILIYNPNKFLTYIHDKYGVNSDYYPAPSKLDLLDFLQGDDN